jgi:DNA-binding CsgD family transcriptional regulator
MKDLTHIDKEILSLVAEGKSTKEITGIMKTTEATTETYRTRAIKKLDAINSCHAVAIAVRAGLI